MTLQSTESVKAGMAIHELVIEAYFEGKRERRQSVRYPFFRSVSIEFDGNRHAAFSREISASGIGLLHNVELARGEVEITVPNRRGRSVRILTRILWCRPCGEGWFISGGRFIDVIGIGG